MRTVEDVFIHPHICSHGSWPKIKVYTTNYNKFRYNVFRYFQSHKKFSVHLSVTSTWMYHIKEISFWLVSVDLYIYIYVCVCVCVFIFIYLFTVRFTTLSGSHTGSSAERKNAK